MLDETPSIQPRPRGLVKTGLVLGGAAAVVVVIGLVIRSHQDGSTQQWSNDQAVPTVHLVAATRGGKANVLALPGTLAAWNEAKIFARVPGYVRGWYRDIGAHVGAGTPLGAIDTPELDQQIIQARASLDRARAEEMLARTTAERWKDLLSSASVSRQEADVKNADAVTHAAAVREAQANLGRLLAMKAYATLRAPFAGEVTMRNADIGDLVGPGATAQTPLFIMADEHRMRIYVNVPQQYSAAMHAGLTADLMVPEAPSRVFHAQLIATSGAIDSRSGALQVQLVTDNADGALKTGGYAQLRFDLPNASAQVTLPASALVLRAAGTQVATVTSQRRVHMLRVELGRDLGGTVEIASGLPPATKVIDNPPDSVSEGEKVRVETGHE